jgi:hypothetical protein
MLGQGQALGLCQKCNKTSLNQNEPATHGILLQNNTARRQAKTQQTQGRATGTRGPCLDGGATPHTPGCPGASAKPGGWGKGTWPHHTGDPPPSSCCATCPSLDGSAALPQRGEGHGPPSTQAGGPIPTWSWICLPAGLPGSHAGRRSLHQIGCCAACKLAQGCAPPHGCSDGC